MTGSKSKANRKRQWITGANSLVVVVGALAIAVMVNLISAQVFLRVDLTESDRYTLSEASVEAVRGLEEPVKVKVFISANLPEPYHNLEQSVADTLEEYQARSEGNLSYEIIVPEMAGAEEDSEELEEVEEAARGYGCQKVLVGEQSADRASVRQVFKCMAFQQGSTVGVISDIRAAGRGAFANLEYEITKELLNLANPEARVVGFVQGLGGIADQPQFVQQIQAAYRQLYGGLMEARGVDLSGESPTIEEEIDALVILNVDKPASDGAKFALDQFVQRGGSVGWYQSATVLDLEMLQRFAQQMGGQRPPMFRKEADTGLVELFAAWGIEHRRDLLVDYENGMTAAALTAYGIQEITLPATFQMDELDRRLPFMQGFSSVAFATPSSLVIDESLEQGDEVTAYRVVQTRDTATRVVEEIPSQFDYQAFEEELDGQRGQYTVVAALQGAIPSYYEEEALPEGKSEEDKVVEQVPGRVLVVGSGDFLQPNPDIGYDGGLVQIAQEFFFASTEWLAQDTSLTEIRSKSMPSLLPKVDLQTQRMVQFINIAMVPAVFALVGLVMYARRKRRRAAARAMVWDATRER